MTSYPKIGDGGSKSLAETLNTTSVCPLKTPPSGGHSDHNSVNPCAASSGLSSDGVLATAVYTCAAGWVNILLVTQARRPPLRTEVAFVEMSLPSDE